MAKLTSPLYSVEAHGSVGSVVYRSHRGAAIASAKAAPHHAHSGPISDRLQHLCRAAHRWRGFGLRQRYGWKFYARNRPRPPGGYPWKEATGFAIFLSCAIHLAMCHHPPQDDPPPRPLLGTLTYMFATQHGTDIKVDYIYTTLPDPGILSIQINLAGPFTFGRNARLKDSKRVANTPVDSYTILAGPRAAGVYTLFGRLVDRQGLASPWLSATVHMERV